MGTFRLDLNRYLDGDETCLVGRLKGEVVAARMAAEGICWEDLDQDGPVIIEIPERIVTVNPTFWYGVWGNRIQALGKTKFRHLYSVVASEHIQSKFVNFTNQHGLYRI